MGSQTDLDQGGTFREWNQVWMGPSIGWVRRPVTNVLDITIAGTYVIDLSVSLITVNVAGAVIIKLPAAAAPAVGPGPLPGLFVRNPITIVDVGGKAFANNITIQPSSGAETIMGLASIAITINYGGFTLNPQPSLPGWISISP